MIKRLKQLTFFQSEIANVHAAALILGGAGLLSRVLGVLRDRMLAARFGAGRELDIYTAAFNIPDFMSVLFLLGGATAVILPVFQERLMQDPKKARDLLLSGVFYLREFGPIHLAFQHFLGFLELSFSAKAILVPRVRDLVLKNLQITVQGPRLVAERDTRIAQVYVEQLLEIKCHSGLPINQSLILIPSAGHAELSIARAMMLPAVARLENGSRKVMPTGR